MAAKNQSCILFVTSHNPWGTGGGCTATRLYLDAIMELYPDDNIDLCIYSDFELFIPLEIRQDCNCTIHLAGSRPAFDKFKSLINGQMHRHQHIAEKLLDENRYRFCFFDKSHIAGTLCRYAHHANRTPVATLHHNYEPDYFKYETGGRIFKAAFLHHVKRLEKQAFRNSDINLFLSEDDKTQYEQTYGIPDGKSAVTGLFEKSHMPPSAPARSLKGKHIIITGSLNNLQNLDGIRHFITHIYPVLPDSYRVTIAGQSPLPEIYGLCNGKNNITVIPSPPDIAALTRDANLFLCTTRVGSGIKIRITAGLNAGLPVITHSVSARGYGDMIRAGVMKSYTTPEEFINALSDIDNKISTGELSPEKIQQTYATVFNRKNGLKRLKDALDSIRG